MFLSTPTLIIVLIANILAYGQFAPRAGQQGSTAIKSDSAVFKAWASSCTLHRGYMNMANPLAGRASAGNEKNAVGSGAVYNGVVSLGDGGSAILTFEKPITNGPSYDFAVFENGFKETGGLYDFLEYAFVEVSSDGQRFVRFPAQYAGDFTTQIAPFQPTDTRLYHNLAGKYTAGFGTPFDLEELKDSAGLDVNKITHIRVVDVIGSTDSRYATTDSKGRYINEPWPTEFESSGFDLDAVGVLHVSETTGLLINMHEKNYNIYPNPCQDNFLATPHSGQFSKIELTDFVGKKIKDWISPGLAQLDVSSVEKGIYLLHLFVGDGVQVEKLEIR
jgi:hypothetical protein